MQRSAVVVVADKTSLKRPFIFANAVHMALCFFMLTMTVAWHRDLLQTGKLVSTVSVVIMYVVEISCLLLSVLGVVGACKGKRWCLILYATGMAAASQTIIVRTALSYQDVYEKRVAREESKLLAMMPLSTTSKANRTLLYSIQQEFECCGLIEGYKDWGSSIPASCNCHYPGKCIRLRGSATLGAPKNQYVYQEPCLPIYVSELKLAFSLAMAVQFGSGVFWLNMREIIMFLWLLIVLLMAFSRIHHTYRRTTNLSRGVSRLSIGGSTRHEHQADGPDKKETGVHGSSPIQQIRSRCLLVTLYTSESWKDGY